MRHRFLELRRHLIGDVGSTASSILSGFQHTSDDLSDPEQTSSVACSEQSKPKSEEKWEEVAEKNGVSWDAGFTPSIESLSDDFYKMRNREELDGLVVKKPLTIQPQKKRSQLESYAATAVNQYWQLVVKRRRKKHKKKSLKQNS